MLEKQFCSSGRRAPEQCGGKDISVSAQAGLRVMGVQAFIGYSTSSTSEDYRPEKKSPGLGECNFSVDPLEKFALDYLVVSPHFNTSILTFAVPSCTIPISRAAPSETSSIRSLLKGPRSFTVTSTDFPLLRFVTRRSVPKGNSLCAAVNPSLLRSRHSQSSFCRNRTNRKRQSPPRLAELCPNPKVNLQRTRCSKPCFRRLR